MAFCLLPGLLLFILNQALAFKELAGRLVLPLLLLCLGMFFLLGLLAAALNPVFGLAGKERFLFKLVCITSIIYLAISGGLELATWRLHYKDSGVPVSLTLSAVSMVLFGLGLKWRAGDFRKWRRWFLYLGFLALVPAWSYYTPDIGFAFKPLQYALETALLLGLMTVIYQLRAGIPLAAYRSILAVALALACIVCLHLARGYFAGYKVQRPGLHPGQAQAAKDRPNIILIIWDAVAESYPTPFSNEDPLLQVRPLNLVQRAVYFGDFKYLASSDGSEELYDLRADPSETINLISRNPAKAEQGRTLLKEFLAKVPEAPRNIGQQGIPLTPEQARALRALGYAH